jgi:DNA-directed RNA polymerase specialized sigma subunit
MKNSKDSRSAADVLDQLRKEHFSFSQVNPDIFPDFQANDRSTMFLKDKWEKSDKAERVMILQSLLENEKAKQRRLEELIEEAQRCLDDNEKKIVNERKKHLRTLRYGRIPAIFIKDNDQKMEAAD